MKKIEYKRMLELAVCDLLLALSFFYFPEKTPGISKLTATAAMFIIHLLYIPAGNRSAFPESKEKNHDFSHKKSPVEKPLTKFLYMLVCVLAAVSIGSAILIS